MAKLEFDRPHEAIQDYNHALLINPDYWDCLHNRAMAYEQIGNLEKSLWDYEKLIAHKDSVLYQSARGLIFTTQKKYDKAIAAFEKVLLKNPEDAHAMINLAIIDYYQENHRRAAATLQEILIKYPEEANAYNTLNQIYLELYEWELAYEAIQKALQLAPTNAYFLNNRGFTLLEMDSLQKAITDINQSIVLRPDNAWAFRNKGYYFFKLKDYSQALRYLNQTLEMQADLPEVYFMIGKVYESSGQIELACEAWTKSLANGDKRSNSLLLYACQ